MKQNFLGEAISIISGECAYDTDGETILKWRTSNISQPSQADIDAKIVELEAEWTANEYARNRASAFPSIGDQLDMQFWDSKNGTTTWKDALAKVKSDNPKG